MAIPVAVGIAMPTPCKLALNRRHIHQLEILMIDDRYLPAK